MFRLAFASVVVVLACAPNAATAPVGYYLAPSPRLPNSPVVERLAGNFTLSIDRQARTASDRRLITIAESLFPEPDSIVAAARNETRPIVVARLKGIALRPGNRWWWDDAGDVHTPFAVTGDAVVFYARRIRELSGAPNPHARYEGGADHTGRFSYQAIVSSADSTSPPGTERVVRLTLSWFYNCGMLCAIGFTHARTVYFDRRGRVLLVRGDGIPGIMLS